ncbi:MAG: prepilin peptidase, partial [Akkermansiaceae bacterium]|nr:prepilin peptidase [Akkermansiaceae bacterium]
AAPVGALLVAALVVLLVSISFIDAEHMLIPVTFCYAGMVIGVGGAVIDPSLVTLGGTHPGIAWWEGGLEALIGLVAGWGGLAVVVILGKIFLGEKRLTFDHAEEWFLCEPESEEEELSFVIGEDRIGWSDLFYRKNDRIEIAGHGILLDGNRTRATEIMIYRDHVRIGSERHHLEKMKSLSGKADKVVIPREAMGAGDPPMLGMIGAFLGWKGVLFGLFASCLYALVAAILGRIGFGREMPFGPFLALGGLTWVFGGWMMWEWYFETLAGFGPQEPALPENR